jgi:hypothetical protein
MYVERYQDTVQEESKVQVFWISEKSHLRKRSISQFIKLKYQKHFDLLLQLSKYSFDLVTSHTTRTLPYPWELCQLLLRDL